MSDRGDSANRSRSRSHSPEKRSSSKAKHSKSASKSPPPRSRSRSNKRSRSRSRGRRHDSRSRSHSNRKYRSRSRSADNRRSYKRERSSRYRSGSRSPMSSRRRHQGERENPRKSRCLGIFGLSLYTQERDLREVFERYGPIEDLQIVYDHQTGRSRGFAFIYMKYVEDAMEAKEMAAGVEIDGRNIRVDFSITERAHTPTPGVYLGRPTGGGRYSRKSRSPYSGGGGGGGSRRERSRSYSRSRSTSRRLKKE